MRDIVQCIGNKFEVVFILTCTQERQALPRLSFLCTGRKESLSSYDSTVSIGITMLGVSIFSYILEFYDKKAAEDAPINALSGENPRLISYEYESI